MAASGVLGAATLGAAVTVGVAEFNFNLSPIGACTVQRIGCQPSLSHRWLAVGLLGLVGLYLILVPVVVLLGRRGLPRVRRSGREPKWVGREDSLPVAVAWWVVADLVPAAVALLRRCRLLRAPRPGTERSGMGWENTPAMAVVQSMVVATIIFGSVWLVVWFAIVFGGAGGD